MGFSNHLGKSRLSGFFRHLGNGIRAGLSSIGNAVAVEVFDVLNGLIQWLTGSYYTDSNGDIVDGTILDQSKNQGGYPNIASGYGLDFDGVNDRVLLPVSSFDLSNSFTIEGWLYRNTTVNYHAIYQRLNGSIQGFQVFIPADNQFKIYTTSVSAFSYITPISTWFHFSVTVSGTIASLYINGEFQETIAISAIPSFSVADLHNIGNYASNRLNGYLSNLLIIKSVLTPAQIQELYNGALRPTGITDAEVALDLRMIEGAGTLVKDYSGNGNNGTINGATWLPNIPYGQQMAFAGHNITLTGGSYINVAGTTDDATTDIDGNTITDFVYDADRYKLPTTSVQVFDGVDDGVTTMAVIPSSGQFILRARFAFGDGTDRYVIHAHRNEVTPTDSLGLSITQNFSTANGNLGVGLYVDKSIFRNYQFTGFSSGQIVDVVLAVDVDSDEPLWCIVNGVLKTTYSTTQYIRIVGGSNYGFYFGYDNDNIGRWFDKYIHSVQIDGLHKWSAANGWVDEIGSNNGTVNGSPTSEIVALTYANHATPKTGIGLSFDGVSDSVDVGIDLSAEIGSGDFTFTFLGSSNALADFACIIDASAFTGVQWLMQANGSFRVWFTNTQYNSTQIGYDDNQTHLFTLVREGNVLKMYVDTTQLTLSATDVTGKAITYNGTVYLGKQNSPSTYFWNGEYFYFKIYKSALTPTQIAELYQNPQLSVPTGLTKADLALDLRLDDAATTTARDYSGNANDGTISGATWIYGLEYPVKQVGLSNFNLGLSNELIFGDNDDSLIDIDGNPIVNPRLESEINFPYIYHEGLGTPHRDSMNPTDGVTISFWTEYAFVNNGNAFSNSVISKEDLVDFGVRTNSSDFQLLTNNATSATPLGYAPALIGVHHHCLVLSNNNTFEWYIDGVLRKSGTSVANYTNSNPIVLGGNNALGGTRYTKPIGDPMYFNRALTADEALSIYNFQKAKYE